VHHALPHCLLSRRKLCLLNFSRAQFCFKILCGLTLIFLELKYFALELLLDLLCNLLLVVQLVCDVLVKKICCLCQHFIAKLLSNNFPFRSFWSFINKVLQKIDNFMWKWVQSVILVITQFLGYAFVVLLKEMNALLLGCLFVLHRQHLELLIHLGFQLLDKIISNLSNCNLLKDFKGHPLWIFVSLTHFIFMHGYALLELVIEMPFEDLIGVLHRLQTLIFADVGPAWLDWGYCPFIYRICVWKRQIK